MIVLKTINFGAVPSVSMLYLLTVATIVQVIINVQNF